MTNDCSAQATGRPIPSHGLLRQDEVQDYLSIPRYHPSVIGPAADRTRLALVELMLRTLLSRQLDIQQLPGDPPLGFWGGSNG